MGRKGNGAVSVIPDTALTNDQIVAAEAGYPWAEAMREMRLVG
jgi:hypothetical protein